jgi:DNA-binding transcriptional LysR family regulator
MDRLESMTTFVAAVEAGSLSAAARRLRKPLPTVSRKVAELEQHLGTRLLTRSSRNLSLTDAGRTYLMACKQVLEDLAEAERAATGEYSAPRGDLVMTAPVVFGRLHALPVVSEFLGRYPDIDVRLILVDRMTSLREERIDVALRIGDLPDSSLVASRVGTIRLSACASPAYLRQRGTPRRPQDLSKHACVSFEGVSSPRAWPFRVGKRDLAVRVRSRLVVNTAEAAVDAAVAGLGITRVLSYQLALAGDQALRRVLQAFEPPPIPVQLVYAGNTLLPVKLRAFLDFAIPRLRDRLSSLTERPRAPSRAASVRPGRSGSSGSP